MTSAPPPKNAGKPSDWVSDGEKYALIGLKTKIEQPIPFREIVPGLWAWTDRMLDVPAHWRESLGSIRSKEIESCNLVLLSKMVSGSPGVLDGENDYLHPRLWPLYRTLAREQILSVAVSNSAYGLTAR
jgi:hypothetical protein